MADPNNHSDPTYANDPNYVWSGGRWQNRNAGTGVNPNAPATGGHVGGSSQLFNNDSIFGTKGLFGKDGPLGTPDHMAANNLRLAGVGSEINNFAGYQDLAQKLREGAVRQQATNPYDARIADQSRPAQLALMDQMRGQMNGPSIAAMQGQRALGASGQQALMQGGRAGMLGAQGAGAGLAGDVGQARLGEMMRGQAGIGGAAGNLRGADLRSSEAQMNSGFQAQGINDQMARFYASQGGRLDQARAQEELDNKKLHRQIALGIAGRQFKLGADAVGAGSAGVATAASMGADKK